MYKRWQVYLHKTSIVAEQLLIRVLKRAKELINSGVTLQTSKPLHFFLIHDISLNDFNEEVLNIYLEELDLKTPIGPDSKEDLKRYFKAFFARDLFGQTGYFMVTQAKDNMILKVIELDSKN